MLIIITIIIINSQQQRPAVTGMNTAKSLASTCRLALILDGSYYWKFYGTF